MSLSFLWLFIPTLVFIFVELWSGSYIHRTFNMNPSISMINKKLFSTNVIIYFNFSMPAKCKYLSSFAHLSILAVVQSFGKNCIWYDYCWMEYSKLDLFITGYYLSLVSRHNKKWKKYREYTTRNHKTRWPTCYHCQRQTKSWK